jgi:hypothetical protein
VLAAVRHQPFAKLAARLGSELDGSLVRFVGVAPWSTKLYLVAFTTPGAEPHCEGTAGTCAHLALQETVAVFGDTYMRPFTAADIAAGAALAGAPGIGRWTLVVPDGVSRVAFLLPRKDPYSDTVYRRSLMLTARVHENVAAVQTRRNENIAGMILYRADGHVLERIP